jgi:hypothetical protein
MSQKTLDQLKSDLLEAQDLLKNAKTDKDKSAAQELIDAVVTEAQELLANANEEEKTAIQELIDSVEPDSKTKESESTSKAASKKKTKKSSNSDSKEKEISKADPKKVQIAKEQLAIMDRYKTKELFYNSKNECFTSQNLAELSEKDKAKVKTVTREAVENIIK